MKRMSSLVFGGILLVLTTLSFIPQLQAQSNLIWNADFFNNTTLNGTSIHQSYNNLNFNWGNGSPTTGINPDNWSARFSTIANFNAGIYRFSIYADDGVRLYVHGQLYIDTWNSPRPGQTLTADVNLLAGDAGITVDFCENTGNAYITVSWVQTVGTGNPNIPTGNWLVEYWNNRSLSNSPNVVSYESSPNHDWGYNAPVNGVAADNWSARWSSYQNFSGGNYRITLTVDDGARVYVNGTLVINEWHGSPTIASYVRDLTLFNGLNSFVIEYYEETGIARLSFSIVPLSPLIITPIPIGPARLMVNTGMLNVRSTPYIGDNIINKVSYGATYLVTGRNADSSWWQIQIGAQTGWVSARYVIASDVQNVPVITINIEVPNTPTIGTGYFLQSAVYLNIRTGPGINYNRINILPYNAQAEILARNSSNTWWLIHYSGTTGWVSGAYVRLPAGIDLNRVPVR